MIFKKLLLIIIDHSYDSIKKISKGEKLTANNISTFRPEIGLPADKFKNILGKRLRKSLVAFSPIFKKDLFN